MARMRVCPRSVRSACDREKVSHLAISRFEPIAPSSYSVRPDSPTDRAVQAFLRSTFLLRRRGTQDSNGLHECRQAPSGHGGLRRRRRPNGSPQNRFLELSDEEVIVATQHSPRGEPVRPHRPPSYRGFAPGCWRLGRPCASSLAIFDGLAYRLELFGQRDEVQPPRSRPSQASLGQYVSWPRCSVPGIRRVS